MAETDSLRRLKEELGKLPGIGERSAERIAQHLLALSSEEALALARAIRDVKQKVHACSRCGGLAEGDLCPVCSDGKRDAAVICVVEGANDMRSLEATGAYRGVYHVLGGRVSPLEGVAPEDLAVDALLSRVKAGGVREIVLATNPTAEGDATALFLLRSLAPLGVKVTRIARGLPSGGTIEHANPTMLADAIEGRTELKEGGASGDGVAG